MQREYRTAKRTFSLRNICIREIIENKIDIPKNGNLPHRTVNEIKKCFGDAVIRAKLCILGLLKDFPSKSLVTAFQLLFTNQISENYSSLNIDLFNILYNKPKVDDEYYLPKSYTQFDEFIIDEPLTKILLEREIGVHRITAMSEIFSNFSNETQTMSTKGTFFQNIFLNFLYTFGIQRNEKQHPYKLTDLTFIKNAEKGAEFPNWLTNIDFKVSESVIHLLPIEDLKFLKSFIKSNKNLNRLVCPSTLTGPDGLLILTSKSDYILILIGIKYSSKDISQETHLANDNATNIYNFFRRKNNELTIRNEFVNGVLSKLASKVKILNILVEYSEINSTKVANEFLSEHQKRQLPAIEQFTLQITEDDIINTFINSSLQNFQEFGKNLEINLKKRTNDKIPKRRGRGKKTSLSEEPETKKTKV